MDSERINGDIEISYRKIPEFSTEDVLPRCGFYSPNGSTDNASRGIFLNAMVSAIRSPGWLLVPFFNEESRADSPVPASQYLTSSAVDVLKELQKQDSGSLFTLMKSVEKGQTIRGMAPMAMGDIVVRSLEMMGNIYPNLTMFRGADFDSRSGSYTGVDFAPGDLSAALHYSLEDINGRRRPYPVVAKVSFLDVAKSYSMHELSIETEDNWWRPALVLGYNPRLRSESVKIRRLPQDPVQIEKIEKLYSETAIRV